MFNAFPPNTLYYLLFSPAPMSQGLCITSKAFGACGGRKKKSTVKMAEVVKI